MSDTVKAEIQLRDGSWKELDHEFGGNSTLVIKWLKVSAAYWRVSYAGSTLMERTR